MKHSYDVVVIGGGFFGMYIAEFHATQGASVLLCEKEADFMQHASYVNQARVHNGYHYPRSILTALRSRISFPRFVQEFKACIVDDFEKYYMVGKILSNISARQFEVFCQRIGAKYQRTSGNISKMINNNLIEAVFTTTEYAFDSLKLKETMQNRLAASKVDCMLNTCVTKIDQYGNMIKVNVHRTGDNHDSEVLTAKRVYNCTYAMMNNILQNSGIDKIYLKHELTELCLVEMPSVLKDKGVTVMCGPFFSFMPFPSKSLHSFSHVRYTPHYHWYDDIGNPYKNTHDYFNYLEKRSAWNKMQHDAIRYMPVLNDCQYRESLWEVKTVLPRSESDDSRPILYKRDYGVKGLHCVMGGKIDNVYDVIDQIRTESVQ